MFFVGNTNGTKKKNKKFSNISCGESTRTRRKEKTVTHWPKFLIDWIEENSKLWAPVPRIVAGFIAGPVRWEKLGAEEGTEVFLTSMANKKLENIGAAEAGLSADYGITHLQKQSKWGWLITEPFCFYVWWQIKPQDQVMSDGNVMVDVPGSETCATFRFGKGRWDAKQKNYEKPTLQAGLHWD